MVKYKVGIRIQEVQVQAIKLNASIYVSLTSSTNKNNCLASTSKKQTKKDGHYVFNENLQAITEISNQLDYLRLCVIVHTKAREMMSGYIILQTQELQKQDQNIKQKQLRLISLEGSIKYVIYQYKCIQTKYEEVQNVALQQSTKLNQSTMCKQQTQTNKIKLGPVSIPGIPDYNSLPFWTQEQLQLKRKQQSSPILLFADLVIDTSNFQHPGSNQLLKEINQNQIQPLFYKTQHSLIAKIFLCEMAVARLKNKQNKVGEKIIEQVKSNKDYLLHLATVQKIDFTKSINDQIANLTPQEKTVLADFPKLVDNPTNLLVFDNQQFMYPNAKISEGRFWISTSIFLLNSLLLLIYAINFLNGWNAEMVLVFGLGILVWTLIEYCFHRFLLHKGFNDNFRRQQHLHPHELHHAFPNKRAILSLSPIKNYPKIIGIYFFMYLCFGLNFSLYFMSGLLFGMGVYDSIHYFVHFGPDTNIQPFASLRTHHLKHHYRNRDRGFGVSTTLWDYIFRTGYK